MDPRYTGELLQLLEKQGELLEDGRQSLLEELHKYQIEEVMLMRKLNEVMKAPNSNNGGSLPAPANTEDGNPQAFVSKTNNKDVMESPSISDVSNNLGRMAEAPVVCYTRNKSKKTKT